MIMKQTEQEKRSDICHYNSVYTIKKGLKLKTLKELELCSYYLITLRYYEGSYYVKIMDRNSTNTKKGGISE